MSKWITAVEAAKIIGTNRENVRMLGRDGHLSVRRLPRSRPAYLRSEVEALAEASTRPADRAAAVGAG